MIFIQSKRRKIENIQKDFPNSEVIDVTSKGEFPFVKFSPFYPIGNIPVPESKNLYSESVEGIWQGLKVFLNSDIDKSKFLITKMKGIKRTVRKYGKPLGHRNGTELLDYISARKLIYVPTYNWVLNNKLSDEIEQLKAIHNKKDIVLLDYETNENIDDGRRPFSHAVLIKEYLLNT
ncbi:hypothetical protein [uncultured Lacinutrix sp.]|uniref:DUF6939 family protein n=1 Tax=uncultured Lacinutrix sp. TaxID=574032 RepID=UPI00260B0AC0|nr:hypothetical protein [uncultured Lacinutrix sp.]